MDFTLTGTTPEEKLKELTDKLEQGVREIFTSGRYAEYLAVMSKFHSYSYGNVLLILCLLYTSPSPRDGATSRMPSSA